jgi:hypothetical protein
MQIMKPLLVAYSLLCVATLWSPAAHADSAALAVTIGLHDVYHNAEFNPTGNPIGGGPGYSRIVDTTKPNVVVVDNRADLVRALTTAVSGAVIYVRDDAVIDLTGADPITIPGGVTLASGRGKGGSRGALLYVTTPPTVPVDELQYPLFKTGGPYVRITGLRIQGHDQTVLTTSGLTTGVAVVHRYNEIDNCEIYGWPHAGIHALKDALRLRVHHNYIHHNYGNGNGYGITLNGEYGTVDALIEANYFDYHRHGIAGTGHIGTSCEARYNVFGKNFAYYPVDMHGGGDRGDGTNWAGDWIVVHHNTFYKTASDAGGVHISGIPRIGAWIFSNWFEKPPPSHIGSTTPLEPTLKIP